MHDLKITQLKTFISIVEKGGFHAASQALHKTQPAISLAIKSLESTIGKDLFYKNSNSNLTTFGEEFLKHARSLVDHHDEIKIKIEKGISNNDSSIYIATLPSVAQHLMPKFLNNFYHKYPNTKIHLRDTSSSRIQELVKSHKVDIAICTIHDIVGDFAIKQIAQDRMGIVCHKNHPLVKIQSCSWQNINDYPSIENGTWDILPAYQYKQLIKSTNMNIANMSSLNAVLEANLGITVLPELAYSRQSKLTFIPLKNPTVYRQIGVIKDNHKILSPMAETFFEYLLSF